MAIGLIHPIIRSEKIVLTIVADDISQGRIRIDPSVRPDESLSFRHREHLISKSSLTHRSCHTGRSQSICILRSEPLLVHIVIIKCLVVHFIVLRRIRNHIIILQSLSVPSPFSIQGNNSSCSSRLLGRNHNHTIGTTSAIKRIGCSILEHGHGLNVSRVQSVQIPRERHPVHHIKRFLIHRTGNGTDAPDADRRRRIQTSARRAHLHTSHHALQSPRNIRRLHPGDVRLPDHGSRSRKGILGGSTKGHHNSLLKHLAVRRQTDLHHRTALHSHLLLIITNTGKDQHPVSGSRNRKTPLIISTHTPHRSLYMNGSIWDSCSIRSIQNAACHLHILSIHHCRQKNRQRSKQNSARFHRRFL